jgi:hypothetical protein
MNFTKFFTKEGHIAGLSISDDVLKLALLEAKKKTPLAVKFLFEEQLAPGDVVRGQVINKDNFLKSLKKLIARSKPRIKYVIASLPAESIYAKIFSFPPGISGEKLDSAIRLVTNFQLPKKVEEINLDWEKIIEPEKNQALLSLIEKKRAREMLDLLESAGLHIVALEYHQMGVARMLKLPAGEPILFLESGSGSLVASVMKNNTVRFLRNLPIRLLEDKTLGAELQKIMNYYENEDTAIAKLALLGEIDGSIAAGLPLAIIEPDLIDLAGFERASDKLRFLEVLGAALRGLVPRSQDQLISLMEIGTEEAYRQKIAITFSDFLTKLTIVLASFFCLAFGATWLLALSVQQNFNQQIASFYAESGNEEMTKLGEKADKFNALVAQTGELVRAEPKFSILLTELKSRLTEGITINTLSVPSIDGKMNVIGVAHLRSQLKLFKKSLDESRLLANVELPLENLDKRYDIPFSITFELVAPNALN